jgi:hypothetical protein
MSKVHAARDIEIQHMDEWMNEPAARPLYWMPNSWSSRAISAGVSARLSCIQEVCDFEDWSSSSSHCGWHIMLACAGACSWHGNWRTDTHTETHTSIMYDAAIYLHTCTHRTLLQYRKKEKKRNLAHFDYPHKSHKKRKYIIQMKDLHQTSFAHVMQLSKHGHAPVVFLLAAWRHITLFSKFGQTLERRKLEVTAACVRVLVGGGCGYLSVCVSVCVCVRLRRVRKCVCVYVCMWVGGWVWIHHHRKGRPSREDVSLKWTYIHLKYVCGEWVSQVQRAMVHMWGNA